MIVGVPKEIKTDEYRVAMLPVGVEELVRAGHRVLVQSGAGLGSGITDAQYAQHGAEIVESAAEIYTPCRTRGQSQGTFALGMAPLASGTDGLLLFPFRCGFRFIRGYAPGRYYGHCL
jgi:hypothetical protein